MPGIPVLRLSNDNDQMDTSQMGFEQLKSPLQTKNQKQQIQISC